MPTGVVLNDRDELHRNWLDWVNTNLGTNQRFAGVAAAAATDAAELGKDSMPP
jgi:hypothetical protein